jgi:hypothetical protein
MIKNILQKIEKLFSVFYEIKSFISITSLGAAIFFSFDKVAAADMYTIRGKFGTYPIILDPGMPPSSERKFHSIPVAVVILLLFPRQHL